MMRALRPATGWAALVAAGGLLVTSVAAPQGDPFAFMPKGGKGLLLDLVAGATTAAEVRRLATERRSEAEWLRYLGEGPGQPAAAAGWSEAQRRTLAAYLAVSLPLGVELPASLDPAAWRAALPTDGRELALRHCQSCHSIYSGYLTHARDAQGWRGTFDAPFHSGLPLSPREREEFAAYSALNMPVPEERIPAALKY